MRLLGNVAWLSPIKQPATGSGILLHPRYAADKMQYVVLAVGPGHWLKPKKRRWRCIECGRILHRRGPHLDPTGYYGCYAYETFDHRGSQFHRVNPPVFVKPEVRPGDSCLYNLGVSGTKHTLEDGTIIVNTKDIIAVWL